MAESFASRMRRALESTGSAIARRYTPSGLLFAAVIAMHALLVFAAFVFSHYLGRDIISSLSQLPQDDFACNPATDGLGEHCFGDYAMVREFSLQEDPWDSTSKYVSNYPAAGIMPHLGFAALSVVTGSARVGLIGYMAFMIAALAVPGWWASAGKSIGVRILTVAAFGILSVPALMAIDRGNSIGFIAPVLLALFVGLRRQNPVAIGVAVVLAVMIKPQFIVLLVIFVVIRKWRAGLFTLAAIAVTNFVTYLFWPSQFPMTIWETLRNILKYGGGVSLFDEFPANASFAESIHWVELGVRAILGRSTAHTWADGHQNLIGVAIVFVIVVALCVLGTKIPPVLAGILLTAGASLMPGVNYGYYLVFALPVAAVLLRDPLDREPSATTWSGILDGERGSRLRRVAGVAIVIATAATISRIIVPITANIPGRDVSATIRTSTEFVPLLWLIAIAIVLIAWIPRRIRPELDDAVEETAPPLDEARA